MSISSISSVSAPPAVKPPEASDTKAPEVKSDGDVDASRASASQPAVLAALPPGQGARINQIA